MVLTRRNRRPPCEQPNSGPHKGLTGGSYIRPALFIATCHLVPLINRQVDWRFLRPIWLTHRFPFVTEDSSMALSEEVRWPRNGSLSSGPTRSSAKLSGYC